MSRRTWRRTSGFTTCGSNSTSACSWVRLTATVSTPFWRPSAFSMVPVQREQCSPPMRARMRARPGRSEEIGRDTSELQSLMRISYAVFCLKKKKTQEYEKYNTETKKRQNGDQEQYRKSILNEK